jgi:putative transposase
MPRLPRLELPGTPLHVTWRGINKGAIFLDADDRYHFRRLLRRAFRDHGIALHAFVLMGMVSGTIRTDSIGIRNCP